MNVKPLPFPHYLHPPLSPLSTSSSSPFPIIYIFLLPFLLLLPFPFPHYLYPPPPLLHFPIIYNFLNPFLLIIFLRFPLIYIFLPYIHVPSLPPSSLTLLSPSTENTPHLEHPSTENAPHLDN